MSHNQDGKIKDVWEENMIDEMRKISELIEDYNYISMVLIFKYRILNFQA
jgi:hypothetical protein